MTKEITAVGYKRISEKDQSNNSLLNQEVGIKDYCEKNNITLEKIFTDNGKSAFTFNRPEWIQLEDYIKKNKQVGYLIVYHIDRFSRANLMDALIKLNEIEVKLKVKVLTVTDNIDTDRNDLGVQLMRTINLLFSNNERNRIQDRVKDGIYRSLASGRFCNMAPIGYKNSRDGDKPLIIVNKEKAPYIKKIFKNFNEGMSIEQVRKSVKGLKLTGNSAIQRILANPIYAGIIELPAYKGKPAMEVNAIHEPIISKYEFYAAKNKLNKRHITTQPSEEVWLRGVLHCHCGRLMTAGNSRSKSGKYYWYYKCQYHQKNYSANKLHDKFKEILNELSFSDQSINFFRKNLIQSIEEHQSKKGGNIMRLKLSLSKIQKKIEETQTRYLLNPDIEAVVYSKVITDLKEQEAKLETDIIKATTDTDTMTGLLNDLLPKLNNLSEVFLNFPLHQQHLFINTIFSRSLSIFEEIYRTPYIHPLFADKALILKEKRLLEIEQPLEKNAGLKTSTPDGNCIEHLQELYYLIA